jgi:hypothetical protein
VQIGAPIPGTNGDQNGYLLTPMLRPGDGGEFHLA